MRHGGIVLAYHGCDEEVGERILAGKEDVRVSTNDYDWLGKGAYFWENSPRRALQWAEFLQKHPSSSVGSIGKPFAIGAIIVPGNCLDLCEAASLDILKKAHSTFVEIMAELKSPLPKNEASRAGDNDLVRRKLDCAVINFLHDFREIEEEEAFATVRCPFFEGTALYSGAKIANRTHVQWCIREPKKNIVGYFRVRPEEFSS